MLARSLRTFAALVIGALIASACSSTDAESTTPSTVARAVAEANAGAGSVTVGIILNTASPTAERDQRLAEVMSAAAVALSTEELQVQVESATIDEVADVRVAIDQLASRGVTVITTSCDDLSLPSIVDAAIEQQLLAVTGCVTIPSPTLSTNDPLFIDLASMNDAAPAMAAWADQQGFSSLATLSSELIPDVDGTCTELETEVASNAALSMSTRIPFVELVNEPADVVAQLTTSLATATDEAVEVDAIVLCALPPAAGDIAIALRDAGFVQPIIVPWFAELQEWDEALDDVFVLAPSSVHGDDPSSELVEFYAELDEPEALDAVAADAIAVIARASERAGSSGSSRLAEEIPNVETAAFSGPVLPGASSAVPIARSYRVLEVANGEATYLDSISD